MEVVKRVHVVPLGHEFDRILEPIRDQRADLVYLLEDDGADAGGSGDGDERRSDDGGPAARTAPADYHDELRAELESIVPEVRTRECDLTDVYAELGDVTTIADARSRHDHLLSSRKPCRSRHGGLRHLAVC